MSTEIVTFDFHGDALEVVPAAGKVHVVVRRVCDALGLDFSSQLQKLKKHPAIGVVMIATPSPGGVQETACIEVRSLPLWLATIYLSKVREDIREKLLAYQREAAEVLADHFLGPRRPVLPAPSPPPPPLLGSGRAVPALKASDMDVVATLLREWSRLGDSGRGLTAREVCQQLERPELQERLSPLRWAFERMMGRAITPMLMGNALRRYRWSTLDGMCLIGARGSRGGTARWKVTTIEKAEKEPYPV